MARPRKFDESRVLEAARDRFWRTGYNGTSVNDLSEATALAPQSMYNAFGNKHDLFMRVLDDYCSLRNAGFEKSLRDGASAWQAILDVVTFSDSGREPLPPEGCLLVKSSTELGCLDPEVHARAASTYEKSFALFHELIEQAKRDGELPESVRSRQLALGLITVMQGVEFLAKSGMSPTELEEAKRASVALIEQAVAGSVA